MLVAGGDYVYFTWLAVEGASYESSSIYCVDSTDGGLTWSERVKLTTRNTFNDRQWKDVDDSRRAVITWDYFPNNYYTQQAFAVSDGGCAGFGEYEIIAEGSFLNGVPAIDTNGKIWTSRAEYDYRAGDMAVIVSGQDEDGAFHDDTVIRSAASVAAALATMEDPTEERDERIEEMEEPEEEAERREEEGLLVDVLENPPPVQKMPFYYPRGIQPERLASANFDGFYSPVLGALPDGRIALTTVIFEEGSVEIPDIVFLTYDDGEVTDMILNQDAPGAEQHEPWMVVDAWGGIHVSWFDQREGQWRLYGATSLDGGESFSEYTIGDATFKQGFDDADAYAWVGHFQGLTASDDHVIAVWGDSSEDNVSLLESDTSVGR